MDIIEEYVDKINSKTLCSPEPYINEYLRNSENLKATTCLKEGVDFADVIFIMLRTETLPNGKYDHRYIEKLISDLKKLGKQKCCKNIVISSNVCPGYSDEIHNRLKELNYIVNFSPEWVAQGSIIYNYENPDITVIGEDNIDSGNVIERIYSNMTNNNPVVHRMDRLSSEITKVGLNCFLSTKITYANMIGEIALQSGVDPDPILKAIGGDSRINTKYLKYGYGYGGPCFPRDTRALIYYGNKIGIDPIIIKSVMEVNKNHINFQVKDFMKKHDKSKQIIFNSVTYKEGTIIIEESQQLLFAVELVENGYQVVINEHPDVIEQVKEIYGNIFIYQER